MLGLDTLCTATHFYPLLLPLVCNTGTCGSRPRSVSSDESTPFVRPFLAAASRQLRPSEPRGAAALLRQQPEARRRLLASRASHAVSLGRRSSPSMHPGPALQHQLLLLAVLRRGETPSFRAASSAPIAKLFLSTNPQTGRRLRFYSRAYVATDQAASSSEPAVPQRSIPHQQAERPGPLCSQGELLLKVSSMIHPKISCQTFLTIKAVIVNNKCRLMKHPHSAYI